MENNSGTAGTASKNSLSARQRITPAPITVGKVPPQALDLEEVVLGALMLEKDALTAIVDILRPEMFYAEQHQVIFMAARTLFNDNKPVDMITVVSELRRQAKLEFAGGAAYIAYLTNRVVSSANIEFHARIITEKYIQRELIRVSSEIITQAYDDTSDTFDLLDFAERGLYEISQSNLRKESHKIDDLIRDSLAALEKLKDKESSLTGVASGFTDLDRITGGWQPSDLIIIAARPGMGKTAFVLSCARNAAVDHDSAVAIFSLEMSSLQLVNRLISGETEIEQQKLRKGNLADAEWIQLHHKIGKLNDAPIFIDDTPSLNIFELRTKCRRLVHNHQVKLIIIDYLQLMHGKTDGKSGNREQEIGSISRALKAIAKELNVAVIALSQLSRQVENRTGVAGKKPQLSDLRESGSIEQDADMVIFLYRPEYYDIEVDEAGESLKGVGEVIIGKHRSGELDTVRLEFVGKYVKFKNRTEGTDYGYGNMSGYAGVSGFAQDNNLPSGSLTFKSKMNDSDNEAPF